MKKKAGHLLNEWDKKRALNSDYESSETGSSDDEEPEMEESEVSGEQSEEEEELPKPEI